MDQIWTSLLSFIGQLVSPDWGKVIGLIPLTLLGLVGLYVLWLMRSLAVLGPAERGGRPAAPAPPAGIHMPGPSFAPVFGAVGMALVVFGLVFRGPITFLGLAALVLALIYWLREGMHDYDRVEETAVNLPAVIHDGPPAGVHMPGPSFRPILAGMAMMVVVFGLVFGLPLFVAGILMLIATLLGWLRDARAEYGLVEEADRTGHPRSLPAPHYPTGTLTFFGLVVIVALLVNYRIIPPADNTGGVAGASAAPVASGAQGSSGAAPPAASAPTADVTIVASGVQYTTTTATAPAGKPFTIAFNNQDAGISHNVSIHAGSASGDQVFLGKIVTGPIIEIYDVPALPAGTYAFVCSVHPNMTGTLTVK
ncbi:MAG TPA: cupredoxin domain-containing protein [Verrucomicrobiae bacterium]|jgi:plastocyanin|nr:cupredoxin domain-containing protein [Verrucomicrobiae bacterium]